MELKCGVNIQATASADGDVYVRQHSVAQHSKQKAESRMLAFNSNSRGTGPLTAAANMQSEL